MKKVLIITYYWPPSGGAGVQRWLKFVKFLPQFNWQPVVYTALNGEMPVIDESLEKDIPNEAIVLKQPIWEPYSLYKKFIGKKKDEKINASFLNEGKKTGFTQKISVWIRGNFFIPDARKFWIKPSTKFLLDYISKNKIDYIISSGPPHSMHLIALGIKKKLPNIKWVADFRDPWTNIDFYDKLMLTDFADNKHRKLEKEVLKKADAVLSVGKYISQEFFEIYNSDRGTNQDKFYTITNGFDESDLQKKEVIKDKKFSISHIGTLVKDRNPQVLWEVLREMTTEDVNFANSLEIKFVGKVDIFVNQQLEKFGLTKYVNKIAYLPHNEVIIEQQKSRVLLLLVNNTPNAKGILTGKFFEYLQAGVPIIAIGPEKGELAEIIAETKCGAIVDFDNKEKLKQVIRLMSDYLNVNTSEVVKNNSLVNLFFEADEISKQKRIEKYGRKSLTQELAKILEAL